MEQLNFALNCYIVVSFSLAKLTNASSLAGATYSAGAFSLAGTCCGTKAY